MLQHTRPMRILLHSRKSERERENAIHVTEGVLADSRGTGTVR